MNYFSTEFKRFFMGVKKMGLYKYACIINFRDPLFSILKHKYRIKKFPVNIDDVPEIEDNNDIGVKIYIIDKRDDNYVINLAYPGNKTKTKKVNLLLYNNHYMLVKNINTLLRQFSSKANTMYCDYCGTTSFKKKSALRAHEKRCKSDKQEIGMPKIQNLDFKNYDHKINVPFKIYADFESYFELNGHDNNGQPNPFSDTTQQVTFLKKHKMMAWGYKVVGNPVWSSMVEYEVKMGDITNVKGESIEEDFVLTMMGSIVEISNVLKKNEKIIMTTTDDANFDKATVCFFCNKWLGNDKVRDHDHLTGLKKLNTYFR